MEFRRYKYRPINASLCTGFYRRSNCIHRNGPARNRPSFAYIFYVAFPFHGNRVHRPRCNRLRTILLCVWCRWHVSRVDSKCRQKWLRSAATRNSRPLSWPSMRSNNCEIECPINGPNNYCRWQRCHYCSAAHGPCWHCCVVVRWPPMSVSLLNSTDNLFLYIFSVVVVVVVIKLDSYTKTEIFSVRKILNGKRRTREFACDFDL